MHKQATKVRIENHDNSLDSQRVHRGNSGSFSSTNLAKKEYFDAAPCEGPGCTNIVPGGYFPSHRVHAFCSRKCRNREAASRYIVGICLHCGGEILGLKSEVGAKKFCCREHMLEHDTEQIMGATGKFRPLIEHYMATQAKNYYKQSTLHSVRSSLARFFRFAVQEEGIGALDQVRTSTVTQFISIERERGLTSGNFIGHLSTFFAWAIAEERYERANPVVSRIHSQRGAPADPRPYADVDLAAIWQLVEASGKLDLMLAFSIGEECGLRVGEVANIRLSDVDHRAQKIFVRLPTKNDRTRWVPYHNKVKKCLEHWLEKRDPNCSTDHLLHNYALNPFNGEQLDNRFKVLLRNADGPASSFKFHRLRHSWATRLMNHGMELAVLKELGGWAKWNSMQRYVKVLDTTVQRQYEAAYKKLQEQQESGENQVISLLDFALMDDVSPTTPIESAI